MFFNENPIFLAILRLSSKNPFQLKLIQLNGDPTLKINTQFQLQIPILGD